MSYVIKCRSGIGRVVGEIKGKLMVELLNKDYEPIMKDGKPLSILVDKRKFMVLGVVYDGINDDITEEDLTLEEDPTIDTPENIEFNINNPEDEIDNGDND
jgi:hypothetical protein